MHYINCQVHALWFLVLPLLSNIYALRYHERYRRGEIEKLRRLRMLYNIIRCMILNKCIIWQVPLSVPFEGWFSHQSWSTVKGPSVRNVTNSIQSTTVRNKSIQPATNWAISCTLLQWRYFFRKGVITRESLLWTDDWHYLLLSLLQSSK